MLGDGRLDSSRQAIKPIGANRRQDIILCREMSVRRLMADSEFTSDSPQTEVGVLIVPKHRRSLVDDRLLQITVVIAGIAHKRFFFGVFAAGMYVDAVNFGGYFSNVDSSNILLLW